MRRITLIITCICSIGSVRSDDKFNLLTDEDGGTNTTTNFLFPEDVYRKAFRYAGKSDELKHLTFEQVVQHINYLDSWKAPKEIVEDFPYYLAGYDDEDRPVWMAEAGKYDVRKWVIRGGQDLKNVEKYAFQAAIRILRSIAEKDQPGREVSTGVFFGDAEGFDMTQIYHAPTVQFGIEQGLKWRHMAVMALGRLIVVNVTYQQRRLAELVRPYAGKLMERVEIFGTNKAKWIPELRRLLPEDAIPSWYGGKKSFKPLLVFG